MLASSAKRSETEHYIELLDAGELIEALHDRRPTSSATKPEPDLVARGDADRSGELSAVMVGDSTWDIEAAARAEVKTIAVLTGGFSEAELRAAGAVDVFESLAELRERLDSHPAYGRRGGRPSGPAQRRRRARSWRSSPRRSPVTR